MNYIYSILVNILYQLQIKYTNNITNVLAVYDIQAHIYVFIIYIKHEQLNILIILNQFKDIIITKKEYVMLIVFNEKPYVLDILYEIVDEIKRGKKEKKDKKQDRNEIYVNKLNMRIV